MYSSCGIATWLEFWKLLVVLEIAEFVLDDEELEVFVEGETMVEFVVVLFFVVELVTVVFLTLFDELLEDECELLTLLEGEVF
jgi:hypothetical protein